MECLQDRGPIFRAPSVPMTSFFLLQTFICVFLFGHLAILVAALADDGKFLLAARRFKRATCADYIISLSTNNMSKGNGTYIGKLRCVSNFPGSQNL